MRTALHARAKLLLQSDRALMLLKQNDGFRFTRYAASFLFAMVAIYYLKLGSYVPAGEQPLSMAEVSRKCLRPIIGDLALCLREREATRAGEILHAAVR